MGNVLVDGNPDVEKYNDPSLESTIKTTEPVQVQVRPVRETPRIMPAAVNQNAEPPRPRRRASILANSDPQAPKSELHTKQGRRRSMKEFANRVNSAPVTYGGFRNVLDDSGHTMLRKSTIKTIGNSARILDLDKNEESAVELYRPRRESLANRDMAIPNHDLQMLAKLADSDEDLDSDEDSDEDSPTKAVRPTKDNVSAEEAKSIRQFMKRFGNGGSSAPATGNNSSKEVKWHEVIIKEYAYTVGDNPSVSGGAPLSIVWESNHTETIALNEFEVLRKDDRRLFHELKIPKDVRFERLKDAGLSTIEIAKAIRVADRGRIERLVTKQGLYLAKKEERNEKIKRGLRNFFTNHKKKEEAYLEHALSFSVYE